MPGLFAAFLTAAGWSAIALLRRHRGRPTSTTCAAFRSLARTPARLGALAGFWVWLTIHLFRPLIPRRR